METPTSKIETVMKDIRQTPLYRQLIPMEASIGWPIPLRKGGKVYVTLPCCSIRTLEKGRTILYPPFATITLIWSSQVVVEYVNLRFRNPWPEGHWEEEAGAFPHPAIARLTVAQYRAKRSELLEMYDELFETLTQNGEFSVEWSNRFGKLLRLLLEPQLEPYYRVLGPKFFDRFLTSGSQE